MVRDHPVIPTSRRTLPALRLALSVALRRPSLEERVDYGFLALLGPHPTNRDCPVPNFPPRVCGGGVLRRVICVEPYDKAIETLQRLRLLFTSISIMDLSLVAMRYVIYHGQDMYAALQPNASGTTTSLYDTMTLLRRAMLSTKVQAPLHYGEQQLLHPSSPQWLLR